MAGKDKTKKATKKSKKQYSPKDYEDIVLPSESSSESGSTVEIDASVFEAKQELTEHLLLSTTEQAFSASAGTQAYGFENIVGVGISEKVVNNIYTGQSCVTVYVVAKAPDSQIAKDARVPKEINGVVTDVVATGEFHSFPHRGRYRPAPGGVSIGHFQSTAGTFGCLVSRGRELFILSNNHVLANANNAKIGDAILQPGPYDGGQMPADVIARLSQFVPIQFNGQPNTVDAAIAQADPGFVTPNNMCFGKISSSPTLGRRFMVVKKCGRSTQLTRGIITDTNATVKVGYGTSGQAIFQDQIIIYGIPYIAPFSQPGDSGSLIVSEFGNRPVGLLFAGSFMHTVANKIEHVLQSLQVSIVS